MTQHDMIILYLQDHSVITPMDAFRALGITKLSTRIGELERNKGYKFDRKMVIKKNRYGKPIHYTEYRLMEEGNG